MATPPIPYPLVNGHRFSFASIEAIFNGLPILGFTSIEYSDELMPGDVYGTRPQRIGRTRGKQKATASCEMYELEWNVFKTTLGTAGIGFGEASFDCIVQYAELPTAPVITDVLVGVRVTKVEKSQQDGSDASKVKLTLDPMIIVFNGTTIAIPDRVGF